VLLALKAGSTKVTKVLQLRQPTNIFALTFNRASDNLDGEMALCQSHLRSLEGRLIKASSTCSRAIQRLEQKSTLRMFEQGH
jgi:hypothetical protein